MDIRREVENQVSGRRMINLPDHLGEFLLQHGEVFRGNPLPRRVPSGEGKACFMNAAKLALEGYGTYFEGYALRRNLGLLIHHAWAASEDKVLDNTWSDPEDALYLGVEVPHVALHARITATEVWGVLDLGMGLDLAYIKRQWGWEPESSAKPDFHL